MRRSRKHRRLDALHNHSKIEFGQRWIKMETMLNQQHFNISKHNFEFRLTEYKILACNN